MRRRSECHRQLLSFFHGGSGAGYQYSRGRGWVVLQCGGRGGTQTIGDQHAALRGAPVSSVGRADALRAAMISPSSQQNACVALPSGEPYMCGTCKL